MLLPLFFFDKDQSSVGRASNLPPFDMLHAPFELETRYGYN